MRNPTQPLKRTNTRLLPLPRTHQIVTPFLQLSKPLGRQIPHEVDTQNHEEVDMVIPPMQQLVRVEVKEEGHEIDRFLTKGSLFKLEAEHVMRMFVEWVTGGRNQVALPVRVEGAKREMVSYGVMSTFSNKVVELSGCRCK